MDIHRSPQILLSLPPKMAHELPYLFPELNEKVFVDSDPKESRLGSGGGTAHLLTAAWRANGDEETFGKWLTMSPKLMIHSGGQSRRLPAYAPGGKSLIPIPVMRWSVGQRLDQTLLDLQLPLYQQLLAQASGRSVAMVASGDVLLQWEGKLPEYPNVDVLALGLWARPERAQSHGVFFCPRNQPDRLAFALQKPTMEKIRELSANYQFLIDTGVWLLSERAVEVLLRKCGLDVQNPVGMPKKYELYGQMGIGLGFDPTKWDAEVNSLTSAVLPLPHGQFYHFGTSRDLIESVASLQNLVIDQTKIDFTGSKLHPDQHTQNSEVKAPLLSSGHQTLWIENAYIPATWKLASEHVLTGVPLNEWDLELERGVCLDFVPVEDGGICVRFYGIDDRFSGTVGDEKTFWLGRRAADWFEARGLKLEQDGTDIQEAALFPVVDKGELDSVWIKWLFAAEPEKNDDFVRLWQLARRLSAREIAERVDFCCLENQRTSLREHVLLPFAERHQKNVFYNLDLAATAQLFAATQLPLPAQLPSDIEPMKHVHDQMFRSATFRNRQVAGWEKYEEQALALLREMILRESELQAVAPQCSVLNDQIVWGRSPVRLDLAGGWTDTPPYCLQNGGRVVNLAVNLNGQPPIQVFGRICNKPELVIRSIDLGVEVRVRTFEELQQYDQLGSGFTVAKAAFALAGFLPQFCTSKFLSLEEQLKAFGGGIELSMLCAVPKGSGLGTSSILAATLLGTLGDLCGLDWETFDLYHRTLALEQMLTAGGGWQDQAGGLLRGVKLIETNPGLPQKPTIRWLPGEFFGNGYADETVLLYYTGVTRIAAGILKKIVCSMFLNSASNLRILSDIRQNASRVADALQRKHWEQLCGSVRQSWLLNQQLDIGTNPTEVQVILGRVGDYISAAKLLGAGGGGYMLMFAKDVEAGRRIRKVLMDTPPNSKARFVKLSLSETGFQVTRS